jgi:16S rRNA (cytosine1402-N4)-methyltransferase
VSEENGVPRVRRPRYSGKNPRGFEHKYKELDPAKYPDVVARVLAAGKTPAGTHRPILVAEILEVLRPVPGEFGVDCTLGYGGHAREILARLQPGGRLVGLDADPLELPRTEERLRREGYGPEVFCAYRSNFAGLPAVLGREGRSCADFLLADLGVSSMQLDNPARGFSLKLEGPLDMRMNPNKGQSAAAFLQKVDAVQLGALLVENADEPHAELLGRALAGQAFATTVELSRRIQKLLSARPAEERELSVRRVFQALRIAVNDEWAALDTLLRSLPECVGPGGRIAVLTFHSGEDRRVKKAFEAGLRAGVFEEVAREVVRAGAQERRDNTRSKSAKLRWAIRAGVGESVRCGG